MVTCAIAIIAPVAFIYGLVSCFKLAQLSKESLLSLQAANAKLEEIREHTFSNIYSYYHGTTFVVNALPAGSSKASIMVDNSNSELLAVYIAVCWRSTDGRIVGEDTNLDGVLSAPEDSNNNNKIDSPVVLSTYIARH
jgi:hypothetical protein